ncbi:MAG: 30S ribosomal protein S13 [archaeon]
MEQKMKEDENEEKIIRIMSKDIPGRMKIYPGLTRIKGISWAFARVICMILKIDEGRKIGSLTEGEIKKISEFAKKPENVPRFLLNRRFDFEEGDDKHYTGSDLELRKDFDIKRLKKIRSYKGIRHLAGLPLRGQRTKGNFRRNKTKSVGIKKKGKSNEKKA